MNAKIESDYQTHMPRKWPS